jgi:hypothetical protein
VQAQASDPDAEFKSCRHCGRSFPSFQRRHRARDCPGYSEIWAGDVRVKLFAAMNAYADEVASVAIGEPQVRLLTVTAPGVDFGISWDEDHCRHLGPHRHSGTLGCSVSAAPAAAWNGAAPRWWRSLHNEASQATLRRTGHRPRLLARPWELQKRGMLHVHPVVGSSTVTERQAADVYQQELAGRAARHGFGFVDRKLEVRHPRAAAAYLSSYFVSGRKGKMTLREAVTSGSMPPSIVYVAPELSRRSGITMRTLRLRRYAWQVWRCEIEPRGLDEVGPGDVWQGLQAGKTLAAIVTSCLDRD